MIRSTLLAACLVLTASSALALEPKKPSDLVTLLPNGVCEGSAGLLYGFRLNPDGQGASAFTVPPKHVFVVTRWSFFFSNGTPGAVGGANLKAEGAVGAFARVPFEFAANGVGGVTAELAAVVGEGATLCGHVVASGSPSGLDGVVEGYLTKAK